MIYLDNSATTRVSERAAEVARKYMTDAFYNPASAYISAVNVERDVKKARERLAKTLDCTADEIIYTSGGTESNNSAIIGTILKNAKPGSRLICSAVEHPSVYEVFVFLKNMGYDVKFAPVHEDGGLDMNAFGELLNRNTALVSIMQVNNETGTINDIGKCRAMINALAPNAVFHSDGVQGYGKLPFSTPNCDLYSISGHKIHAPKGIGALYVAKDTKFFGSLIGGGQERGLRSGTTNVPGIMAMDAAIEDYMNNQDRYIESMYKCKLRLANNILSIPYTTINGCDPKIGAPHILNASFLGVRGEVLLNVLSEKGIYVSTGSACSSHKKGSRVLDAMGLPKERKDSVIRFSLCPSTTLQEIDAVSDVLYSVVASLRKFQRR